MADASASGSPPAEKPGFLDDLIDTIVAPAKLFTRGPSVGFGVMVLFVTVLVTLLAVANRGPMSGVYDAEFAKIAEQMRASGPEMTEEIISATRTWTRFANVYGLALMFPIMMFCVGVVTFVGAKVVGAELNFGGALKVVGFAFVPRVIEQISIALQGALLNGSEFISRGQYSLGPARFMDPAGSLFQTGLGMRFDLFVLWSTVLIVIGVTKMGKVSMGKGVAVGLIAWVAGGLMLLQLMSN